VEKPYMKANVRLAEPIFVEVDDNYDVIVHEAQLCQELLENIKADFVHLDSTMGGVAVDELSPVELLNLKVSPKARGNLLKVLPKLRRIAGEIRRKHGLEMKAIGKESMLLRVSELTAGAEAILYACRLALEEELQILLGLPAKCEHHLSDGKVFLNSLMEAEHDVTGYAQDTQRILDKVDLTETFNPVARGFRALRIVTKP